MKESLHNIDHELAGQETLPTQEVKGVTIINLSTVPLEKAINYLPGDIDPEKIVFLPDLNPGRSPLPTGCVVSLNKSKNPEWRKYAVSDVGCGMQVLETNMSWEEFEDNHELWDQVYENLKANRNKGLGDLGSGNHFLDAAVDDEGKVHFIIHTGSREQSRSVEDLTESPVQFDKKFAETVEWARENRNAVAGILQDVYGQWQIDLLLDRNHNHYEDGGEEVVIRKGAVRFADNDLTVIPSTMDGQMVLVTPKGGTAEILDSMSHGTGRVWSRGEAKERTKDFNFEELRSRIYIPEGISDASLRTENPECYRDIDECMRILEPVVEEVKRLTPIAYIGQV